MNAMWELREGLRKRGESWHKWPDEDSTTWQAYSNPHTATESMDGTLIVTGLTPAQAIAATLGSEDTYTREDVESAFVSGYSLGLDMFDSSKPDSEKGWNQNERDMEEEMEDLGWVRKDAATLGESMTDTEKAALEKRIDELCSEVERLHSDQAHWELGNCPSCPNIADLQEALEQNDKLRNILAHAVMLADLYEGLTDTRLSLDGGIVDCDWLRAWCKKLGIEVPS